MLWNDYACRLLKDEEKLRENSFWLKEIWNKKM